MAIAPETPPERLVSHKPLLTDRVFSSSPTPINPAVSPSGLFTLKSDLYPASASLDKRDYSETGEMLQSRLDSILDHDAAFIKSGSRVLMFYDLPLVPSAFLFELFYRSTRDKDRAPIPKSLWVRCTSYAGTTTATGVWAVFGSHAEARAALAYFSASVSISPALESDLEPLHSLQRFQLRPTDTYMSSESTLTKTPSIGTHRPSKLIWPSHPYSSDRISRNIPLEPGYTISSNPPNPRTAFRAGDWICPSTNCAAHNFGRNLSCIGCGCPRPSPTQGPFPQVSTSPVQSTRLPSPRFAGAPEPQMPPLLSHKTPHVLTPSGRAFSMGGRVQDISSDPLSPCIMFWPDNEPLPEQGQIREGSLAGFPHPPILNTGNRGPIEHQPGDWVCKKCNYLNWRRRKVCQTCYPYADGNGDSIPAAVQADRIERLREALTATLPPSLSTLQPASASRLPLQPLMASQRPHSRSMDSYGSRSMNYLSSLRPRDRAQSAMESGSRFEDTIYQTSGHPMSSSLETMPLSFADPSGHFLPSCLQEVLQSPSLSPTSTASADLSADELVVSPISVYSTNSQVPYLDGERPVRLHRTPSSVSMGVSSIWQLDGEESKALSGSKSSQGEVARVQRLITELHM
ncbi:hypothetical protein BC834DRAFT_532431 [Gloeopeniophorella convolvens]|nr:hypothetical protein BC834DRAFT_532431 [Gloeopeniophorella convolvens]